MVVAGQEPGTGLVFISEIQEKGHNNKQHLVLVDACD